ncbi:MAG: 3-isopropylmalate dehydratase small subunit [Candidatus Bathyarchaeia archaeon]
MGSWKLSGKVWKFGDDINTDIIISGKYKFKTLDMKELASHAMEAVDPEFAKKVTSGDIIFAGKNFGCGSSREQAPRVLKELGLSAVVASSFARIFYRNAINIGLPLIESKEAVEETETGDMVSIDLTMGTIRNETKGRSYSFTPIPTFMLEILQSGGLVEYLKKRGGYNI